MKTIKDQTFDQERALYNLKDTIVKNCKIEGEEDGESALKECRNIQLIYDGAPQTCPKCGKQLFRLKVQDYKLIDK